MGKKLENLIVGGLDPINNKADGLVTRRNYGAAVMGDVKQEDTGEMVSQMVGVDYNSKESENFVLKNKDLLAPNLKIDNSGTVYGHDVLSFEHMGIEIASKRRQGIDWGVDEYFKEFQHVTSNGDQYTFDILLKKLGFDKKKHTLSFFLDTSIGDSRRFLIPEVIRDVVFRAMIQAPRFGLLTGGRNIAVDLPEAKLPEVLYSGDELLMEDIGEAENLPEVTIDFSERTIKIYRRGIRVPINADVIKYVRYPILERTLEQIGWRLGNQLSDLAILTLLNGDLPNSGYPAGVMGVYNTTNKIKHKDIIRLSTRYMQTMYRPNAILANEAECIRVKDDSDFKPSPNVADPLFRYKDINGEDMDTATLVPSDQIANDKQLWVDTSRALSQLTLEGMTVENERHARTNQWEYYIRLATGFQNEDQQAKVLLDGGSAFTAFPSYLDLVK
jgi:hypothetical protein